MQWFLLKVVALTITVSVVKGEKSKISKAFFFPNTLIDPNIRTVTQPGIRQTIISALSILTITSVVPKPSVSNYFDISTQSWAIVNNKVLLNSETAIQSLATVTTNTALAVRK